jgi:hypothetical protein
MAIEKPQWCMKVHSLFITHCHKPFNIEIMVFNITLATSFSLFLEVTIRKSAKSSSMMMITCVKFNARNHDNFEF